MNIITLYQNIRDAVHDDSATQAWCTTNYARKHKVYVGIDVRQPPDEGEYPLVNIYPGQRVAGDELEQQENVIGVVAGLVESGTLTTSKTNVVELKAISYVETFRKKIETAVVGATLLGAFIQKVETDYDFIESFPFCFAFMDFYFGSYYSQGDDKLA